MGMEWERKLSQNPSDDVEALIPAPLVWMILIQHAKTNRQYLSVTLYSSVTEVFIYSLLYFTCPESNQLQCVIFLNREVTECLQEVLR